MSQRLSLFVNYYLPIVAVLLLAAGLRILGADHFPVWTDEGWTTWAISTPTLESIIDRLAQDRHPPLFFLALGYWSRIAGDSHLALRLPSILLGVLTVAMVFRIGDDTFGRTAKPGREDVSWYGMLMYAVLPVAVYYSQEIRHYGWFVAAVCWSSLLFVRVLRRPRWPLLAMYAVSVALMMYILYFGIWVVVAQVVVAMVLWRGDASRDWQVGWGDRAKVIAAWAGALLLYVPWLIVIAQSQFSRLTGGITTAPGTFGSTLTGLHGLLALVIGGGFAMTAGLYVVGFWGSLVSDRTDVTLGLRMANPAWLAELYIVIWSLGIFVVLALINIWVGVLSARTAVFLSPAFMLVIGAGIVRLRTGVRWSLLVAYITASIFLSPLIQPRLDYDVAAEALAEYYSPGDLVVLETGWDDNAFQYELQQVLGEDARVMRTWPWVNNRSGENAPVMGQGEVQDALDDYRRVWVVQWFQAPQVLPALNERDRWRQIEQVQTYVGDEYNGRFRQPGNFEPENTVDMRLFARPNVTADNAITTFGDTFTLTDAIYEDTLTTGQPLYVDLWWQAAQQPDLDYSLGVYLFGEGGAVVADVNQPLTPDTPTSAWQAGGTLYHSRVALTVPPGTPPAPYELRAQVYYFERPDDPLLADGDRTVLLGPVDVTAD